MNRPPPKIAPMKWVYFTGAVFLLLFAAVIAFILAAGRLTIPNGLYYFILILLGLGAAGFLFGAMRSFARYKGQSSYGNLELGGPVVVLALVVIGGFYANRAATFSLTVRVHGPGGPADVIREGRLIADLAGVRRSTEIGSDGEVVFADVPAALDGQPVRLIPEVPGYEPPTSDLSVIPESHIIELALARKLYATPMHGTVRDGTGRLIRNAALNFNGGTATAVSDASGNFTAVIPMGPGKVIPLTVTVGGKVVYDENVTVAEEPALVIVIKKGTP